MVNKCALKIFDGWHDTRREHTETKEIFEYLDLDLFGYKIGGKIFLLDFLWDSQASGNNRTHVDNQSTNII